MVQTLGAGHISHAIEGPYIAARPSFFTLSFLVKANVTGTLSAFITNSQRDRWFAREFTINAVDTWEYKELTFPLFTSGVWLYGIGQCGMMVGITFNAGSNCKNTAGTWYSTPSDIVAGANQMNFMGTVGNSIQFAQLQYEYGEVATPFDCADFVEELNLVRRYCEKSYAIDTNPGTITTDGALLKSTALANEYVFFQYRESKAVPPTNETPTVWSPSTGDPYKLYNITGAADLNLGTVTRMLDAAYCTPTVAAGQLLQFHYTLGSEINTF